MRQAHKRVRHALALAAAWLAATTALAQGGTAPDPLAPLQPQAAVPPLQHRSALQQLQPRSAPEAGAWKEHNERVGRIGGWRAYAREAQQPESPAPAASSPERGTHRHHHHHH